MVTDNDCQMSDDTCNMFHQENATLYVLCSIISALSSVYIANVPSGEERGETDVFAGYSLYRHTFSDLQRTDRATR